MEIKSRYTNWDFKTLWLVALIVFSGVQALKRDADIYLLLQLFIVVISIFFIDAIIEKSLYEEFKLLLKKYSFITLAVMFLIWLLWLIGIPGMDDAKTRNSLPFILFSAYLLLKQPNGRSWGVLIAFFVVTYICETRGAYVLFIAYVICKFILDLTTSKIFRKVFYWSIILFVTFIPIIVVFIVEFYLDVNIQDLRAFEEYRYYISGNIASSVSRIYGVVWLLMVNSHEIFPFGTSLASSSEELLFWGYPVHNFYMVLLLKYGVFGLLGVIGLSYTIYKLMWRNFGLGLTLLFCMVNFNDFYPGFVLFLVPLLGSYTKYQLRQSSLAIIN